MPQPTWAESGGAWLAPGQVAAESLGVTSPLPPLLTAPSRLFVKQRRVLRLGGQMGARWGGWEGGGATTPVGGHLPASKGLEPPAPSASLFRFQFRDRTQLEALRELVSSAPLGR